MSQHHFSADNSQSKYSACDHLPGTSSKPIKKQLFEIMVLDIIGISQYAMRNFDPINEIYLLLVKVIPK